MNVHYNRPRNSRAALLAHMSECCSCFWQMARHLGSASMLLRGSSRASESMREGVLVA